jgi:hypothetical protein
MCKTVRTNYLKVSHLGLSIFSEFVYALATWSLAGAACPAGWEALGQSSMGQSQRSLKQSKSQT